MCVMSVIMDYGKDRYPTLADPTFNPVYTVIHPAVSPQAEREAILRFIELTKRAAEFDAATNQPHCEDPEKIKILERIEQRLARIEEVLNIKS